ncbi:MULTISPECIES: hypothetical protein [unclassified Streptomyces]|uniref:hypothetical protein n=1 Tax=unclassified Streptomyces TaxID=2593676 RepID=UPI002DD7B034|nr:MULTISPECIES: hypothetical protein [unclassified Streptomyces]WSD94644.1 hypothetical protein OG758_11090 [Streptomyces sp. NBC_01474]
MPQATGLDSIQERLYRPLFTRGAGNVKAFSQLSPAERTVARSLHRPEQLSLIKESGIGGALRGYRPPSPPRRGPNSITAK